MIRKTLLVLPLILVAAALAPQSGQGWDSACGCIDADVSFASFVSGSEHAPSSVNLMTDLTELSVANAVIRTAPPGSTLEQLKSAQAFRADCRLQTGIMYDCDVWLQHKAERQRGFGITYLLSDGNTLRSVRVKRIERARPALDAA